MGPDQRGRAGYGSHKRPAEGHYHTNHKRTRNSEHVRNHYNSRPEMGRQNREQSRIIALRDYNNWVKSVIIANWVAENENCLDMCCGKGGDLLKWAYVNAGFLFACDIAEKSISDAKQRSLNMRNRPFRAQFEVADLSKVRIANSILPRAKETNELITFDCVSCQFGLHYAFESEDACDIFFKNATDRLRRGGYFFGTLPNAIKLVKMLRNAQQTNPGTMTFGTDLYSVEFQQDPKSGGEFGSAYDFTLTSAVEKCTEFLVHPAMLRLIGEKYGLQLEVYKGFHEFYDKESRKADGHAVKLLDRMVYRNRDKIPQEQWDIAGLYNVFCFRKVTDKLYSPAPQAPSPKATEPPRMAQPEPEEEELEEEPAPW